jgi:hypothetical protein
MKSWALPGMTSATATISTSGICWYARTWAPAIPPLPMMPIRTRSATWCARLLVSLV